MHARCLDDCMHALPDGEISQRRETKCPFKILLSLQAGTFTEWYDN